MRTTQAVAILAFALGISAQANEAEKVSAALATSLESAGPVDYDADSEAQNVAHHQVNDLATSLATATGKDDFADALNLDHHFGTSFDKIKRDPRCTRIGQPCWKVKRDLIETRDPRCTRIGQPCWKAKRDLLETRDPRCTRIGQPCWKAKRAAEDVVSAFEQLTKRTPEPRCTRIGQPCWKRSTDLNNVYNLAREVVDYYQK